MIVYRTTDYDLVTKIIASAYEWCRDDGCPDAKDFRAPESDAIHYLIAEDEKPIGMFMLIPVNSVCADFHVAMTPDGMGKGVRAARLALDYAFERFLKVVCQIPADNKRALISAIMVGFVPEGINRSSFMRNGKLMDQVILGIGK